MKSLRPELLGFLAFPTRWFWDGSYRDLSQFRLALKNGEARASVCYDGRIGKRRFVAFQDGYVAIKSADKMKAAAGLNAFFLGLTLLTDTYTYPATPEALEKVVILDDGSRSLGTQPLILSSNFAEAFPAVRHALETPIQIVGTDEILGVVEFARRLLRTKESSNALLFLNAGHLFNEGFYTSSFIISWTLVERVLRKELGLQLSASGSSLVRSSQQVSKLSAKQVIRGLLVRPRFRLDPPDPTWIRKGWLRRVDRFRNLRNKLVHESRDATIGDAKRARKLAERAFWRALRHGKVEYATLLAQVRPLQAARMQRVHETP